MIFHEFADGFPGENNSWNNIFFNLQCGEHSNSVSPGAFIITGHLDGFYFQFRVLFFQFFKLVSNEHASKSNGWFVEMYFHESYPGQRYLQKRCTQPPGSIYGRVQRRYLTQEWSSSPLIFSLTSPALQMSYLILFFIFNFVFSGLVSRCL